MEKKEENDKKWRKIIKNGEKMIKNVAKFHFIWFYLILFDFGWFYLKKW